MLPRLSKISVSVFARKTRIFLPERNTGVTGEIINHSVY